MNGKAMIGGFILLLALAACGKVGPLEPTPNIAPPAKSIGQAKAPTSEELMEPSVQSRPGRSAELTRRSERRVDDPFDLPPGSEDDADKAPPPADGKKAEPQ